jgi:hypothetical protein
MQDNRRVGGAAAQQLRGFVVAMSNLDRPHACAARLDREYDPLTITQE